jgi:hypothetical protein
VKDHKGFGRGWLWAAFWLFVFSWRLFSEDLFQAMQMVLFFIIFGLIIRSDIGEKYFGFKKIFAAPGGVAKWASAHRRGAALIGVGLLAWILFLR